MSDSTIVAAKQEYTTQLCDKLSPLIYQGFQSIWETCRTDKKALKTFQEKLCSIPKWNQDIIDNEYKRIVKETDCEWLDKLIEAVFLSNVKVLSTIRIGKVKTINVTVPETKNFIHKCYVETARRLWLDPYLIDDREENLSYNEIKRNINRSYTMINDAIEKTVSQLIPIQNILESYLNEIDTDSDISDPEPDLSDDEEHFNDSDPEESFDNIEPKTVVIKNEDEDNHEEVEADPFMTDPTSITEDTTPRLDVSDGNNISNVNRTFYNPPQENNTPHQQGGMSVFIPSGNPNTNINISTTNDNNTNSNNHEEDPFFSDSDEE